MPCTGADLYQLVVEYSDLGEHRTGTSVDHATLDWLSEHLQQTGAEVERQPFTFDRYDATWEVRFDGEPVQSIPLFYEGVGKVATDQPATMVWESGPATANFDAVFNPFAQQALSAGAAAALVATNNNPGGLLFAVNRTPVPGSGLPTMLVPGALADQIDDARIQVHLDARVVPGASANIIARFGSGTIEETVVITTPISGWFRCAGERGTGVAVALAAAAAISADYPVLFIGASGHEVNHQGARQAIQSIHDKPRAIVHIGASVAAAEADPIDGKATLTKNLTGRYTGDPLHQPHIAEALEAASIQAVIPEVLNDPDHWQGESKNWVHFGRPMFSLVGGFPLFHVPEDTPERATTPDLLASVTDAVITAIRWLAK